MHQKVEEGRWRPLKASRGGPAVSHLFSASRVGPAVSHLFFADDILLFAEAQEDQID